MSGWTADEIAWARREVRLRQAEDWRLEAGLIDRERVIRRRTARRLAVKYSGAKIRKLRRSIEQGMAT